MDIIQLVKTFPVEQLNKMDYPVQEDAFSQDSY